MWLASRFDRKRRRVEWNVCTFGPTGRATIAQDASPGGASPQSIESPIGARWSRTSILARCCGSDRVQRAPLGLRRICRTLSLAFGRGSVRLARWAKSRWLEDPEKRRCETVYRYLQSSLPMPTRIHGQCCLERIETPASRLDSARPPCRRSRPSNALPASTHRDSLELRRRRRRPAVRPPNHSRTLATSSRRPTIPPPERNLSAAGAVHSAAGAVHRELTSTTPQPAPEARLPWQLPRPRFFNSRRATRGMSATHFPNTLCGGFS